jgi:hypothetical protein
MNNTLKNSIKIQRTILSKALSKPLYFIAKKCIPVWKNHEKINKQLLKGFNKIPYCTNLYVMQKNGIQISDNISSTGLSVKHYGRDRSNRPYMTEMKATMEFYLSSAYVSLNASRPSLTAIQVIKKKKAVLGFIGVDIDLRDLPVSVPLYQESSQWQQIKGDPSIRGTVFQQGRVESLLDKNSAEAISILEELFTQRGIFQGVIHFSSSRATIWVVDDPYRYRILAPEAFIDADICMAYPLHPYPENALIPKKSIKPILKKLQKLRLADDTLYLRSASINIFNGFISLTFSCDGSHYIPYIEFIEKDLSFWGCA